VLTLDRVSTINIAVRLLTAEQLDVLRRTPLDGTPNRVRVALALVMAAQSELVEFTQFAQPYVSDVVRGRFKNITVVKAQKFADFFGCRIEDLFPTSEGTRNQPALPFLKKAAAR
jgi:hypothetical protein